MANRRCIELVIWGRGGQGAKTAGDLLTHALYRAGYRPQGHARYSADRMGAPVSYSIRFREDGLPVMDRSWVREPGFVLLFDLGLLEEPGFTSHWPKGSLVVANAPPGDPVVQHLARFRTATVDASHIARDCGLMKGNVPALSSVMPGAFAAASGQLTLRCLEDTMPELRGPLSRYPEPNLRALRAGFSRTVFPGHSTGALASSPLLSFETYPAGDPCSRR